MLIGWSVLPLLAVSVHSILPLEKIDIGDVLKGYDRDVRPGNDTTPARVDVSLFFDSFRSINLEDATWTVQIVLRMDWNDTRLSFNTRRSGHYYLRIPESMVEKLWKPDIQFDNEVESKKEHARIQVYHTGLIIYREVRTLKMTCPVDVRNYPFTTFFCSVKMSSYAFGSEDISFRWPSDGAITITPYIHLPDFVIQGFQVDYCDGVTKAPVKVYSCLRADIGFKTEVTKVIRDVYKATLASLILVWLVMWIKNGGLVVAKAIALLGAIGYGKWGTSQFPGPKRPTYFDSWNVGCNIFMGVGILEFLLQTICNEEEEQEGVEVEEGGVTGFFHKYRRNLLSCGRIRGLVRLLYPVGLAVFVATYYFQAVSIYEMKPWKTEE